MVEGDRHLDQSLEKPALRLGCTAPGVFEDLVGVIELAAI